jgi:putative addiction module component (TIGR02574 family)
MARSYQEVKQDALALSAEERQQLGDDMYGSVAEDPAEEIEAAWLAEVERRARDVDEGKARMLDGDEVMAWLLARARG